MTNQTYIEPLKTAFFSSVFYSFSTGEGEKNAITRRFLAEDAVITECTRARGPHKAKHGRIIHGATAVYVIRAR